MFIDDWEAAFAPYDDPQVAVTVFLAILGTTLSCLNTAVRVSYAMAQDKEMPELLGAMHGRFATPHRAIWVLVAVSSLIAGTYAPPAVHDPMTAAIWGIPSALIRAWL